MTIQLVQISESSLHQIRKTDDNPPMVSVLDVIAVIRGSPRSSVYTTWKRLKESYPEVLTACKDHHFQGIGEWQPTPVATASGIVRIIMVLPGKAAAGLREAAADLLVRYLGGDTTLIGEIYRNRQVQEELSPYHPVRETVENDRFWSIKMDIEEATLDRQLKKTRREIITDALDDMQTYKLPIDESIKIPARDMIANITFGN